MNKRLRKREGETLAQWCERIAPECKDMSLTDLRETLNIVSRTSYIEGILAEKTVNEKLSEL